MLLFPGLIFGRDATPAQGNPGPWINALVCCPGSRVDIAILCGCGVLGRIPILFEFLRKTVRIVHRNNLKQIVKRKSQFGSYVKIEKSIRFFTECTVAKYVCIKGYLLLYYRTWALQSGGTHTNCDRNRFARKVLRPRV